ncbi:MAG TPA: ParB/RepB/Spo0J family partition protein [Nevskiaceae bacterium]
MIGGGKVVRRRGLDRGLDALLGVRVTHAAAATGAAELRELPVEALQSGASQPRQHFDEEALAALTESIRAQGIVEPLIVRPADGGFEVIAGERRWRAARRAGLTHVPALVREMDARDAMAIALVENIQRADLNPMEEAEALRRLIDECHLTHEQAAAAVGRSRAAVSNVLRLLALPASVQTWLREGRLSFGHAKVLMGAAPERQAELAQRVVALGLSVRQTELLIKKPPRNSAAASSGVAGYAASVRSLRNALGSAVQIRVGSDGRGRVVIPFRDRDALDALVKRLARER